MKKMFFILISLISPSVIFAATECKKVDGKLTYCPLEPAAFEGFGAANTSGDLGLFLSQAFQFGLAIAAALAVVMIVYGGVEIMLSESLFSKEDGKKKVWDAVWGLLLALVSWLILYTINPDILNFKL
jgi:hypothetical protein